MALEPDLDLVKRRPRSIVGIGEYIRAVHPPRAVLVHSHAIASFPYDTAATTVALRLLDADGAVWHRFPDTPLPVEENQVTTHRLTHDQLVGRRLWRVQWALSTDDERGWREGYPVVRRPGRLESVRTIRLPLSRGMAGRTLALAMDTNGDAPVARVTLGNGSFAGTVEILRNGMPAARTEVVRRHGEDRDIALPLPLPPRSPRDVFVARYTNLSGDLAFSPPTEMDAPAAPAARMTLPVLVTGADFDEQWPLWSRRITRFDDDTPSPRMEEEDFYTADIFALRFDCDAGEGTFLESASGWALPAMLGVRWQRWLTPIPERRPTWERVEGPEGGERFALHFDGVDDNIFLPSRSLPYGPYTVEAWIRPEAKDGVSTLFHDANGAAHLWLDAEGRLHFARLKDGPVVADAPLVPGAWAHVAAVYDGRTLRVYVDGVVAAVGPAAPDSCPLNSVPVIGATARHQDSFHGLLAGFALTAAPLAPHQFALPLR